MFDVRYNRILAAGEIADIQYNTGGYYFPVIQPTAVEAALTLLANGKLLLDTGRAQNVSIGMNPASIESNAPIKITEIQDNGSVAEVATGSPKEKEALKPK